MPNEPGTSLQVPGPDRPKILIVEQDLELNRMIVASLRGDYEVISAFDGAAGLDRVLQSAPAAIVTALALPKLTGLEMIERIRLRNGRDELPIMILCSPEDEQLKQLLLDDGVQDFLNRPFTGLDLNLRVRNLLRFQRAQQKYQTLLESMDEGFCTIEVLFDEQNRPADYRFLEINGAFEHQTGLVNARGRRMRDLAPVHEQAWFDIYGQVALTGEAIRFENHAAALGRWYQVYAFRVGPPALRQVALFFDDITARKQIEFSLEKARRELHAHSNLLEQQVNERTASLKEAVAQMEEFSYSVSHDLRAPTRAMQSYAEALLVDYANLLDATGKDYLQRIIRGASRMDRLTADVLMYSKLAKTPMDPEPIELESLIAEIIRQFPQMQPPGASVEVVSPLQSVLGHEPTLMQAISNLMVNAAKFVAQGIQPQIRIWTEAQENQIRLWVADNGIGIDPQYHRKIFGMFEQVHEKGRFEGTGIGLAIVRKAIERMGGSVGFTSDGQTGSQFWIQLPAG